MVLGYSRALFTVQTWQPCGVEPGAGTFGASHPNLLRCHLLCLCFHPPSWKLCFEGFTSVTFFRIALGHWSPACAVSLMSQPDEPRDDIPPGSLGC